MISKDYELRAAEIATFRELFLSRFGVNGNPPTGYCAPLQKRINDFCGWMDFELNQARTNTMILKEQPPTSPEAAIAGTPAAEQPPV